MYNFRTLEDAYDAYQDICFDARNHFLYGPDPSAPEYAGKDIPEALAVFHEQQKEEAKRIVRMNEEWLKAVEDIEEDDTEKWFEFYASLKECYELERIIRMVGEDY